MIFFLWGFEKDSEKLLINFNQILEYKKEMGQQITRKNVPSSNVTDTTTVVSHHDSHHD